MSRSVRPCVHRRPRVGGHSCDQLHVLLAGPLPGWRPGRADGTAGRRADGIALHSAGHRDGAGPPPRSRGPGALPRGFRPGERIVGRPRNGHGPSRRGMPAAPGRPPRNRRPHAAAAVRSRDPKSRHRGRMRSGVGRDAAAIQRRTGDPVAAGVPAGHRSGDADGLRDGLPAPKPGPTACCWWTASR